MPANSLDDRKTCDEATCNGVQPLPPGLSTGALVVARGVRAQVETTLQHDDCCELRLLSLTGKVRQTLLWPFDRPVPLDTRRRVRVVSLRRWTQAIAHALRSHLDPLVPRASPGDVDVVAYQLAPALAVARGTGRILLSDEVGLGKTIQAGWIVADLIARDPASRVLLAVPASVKAQWTAELARRFRVDAVDVDARWMRRMIADLPADVAPWTAPGVYVASIDFLKRADTATSLLPHIWDALVVDEAHAAAAPTDRHAVIASIARAARRVILISATPYSGDPAAFASMTALGAIPGGHEAAILMFRRFREEVGDTRRRRHRFTTIRLTPAEANLQRLLERYSREVWEDAGCDRVNARLAVTILRKRALSSAVAAAASLRRRRDLLSSRTSLPRQLTLFEDDEDLDDEVSSVILAAPGLADAAIEEQWLTALIAAADAAADPDSKLRYLQRLLRRLRHESAVIFTEYRDTLLHLSRSLPPSLQLHGGLSSKERSAVQQRFNENGGLLLATDAASEGLNLHGRCRVIVNYELPWNPARLEQRIGRVDRIGQSRTVHALTLTARDTAEDLVIANLSRRLSRVVATLGAGDRLGAFLDEARVAHLVIGGAALAAAAPPSGDVQRADAVGVAETEAARGLRDRAGARGWPSRNDILVSAVQSREAIPPGCIVVFSSTAETHDGTVVARRTDALCVRAWTDPPASARAARAVAEGVLEQLPPIESLIPSLDEWFRAACATHERSTDCAAARERGLRDRMTAQPVVQPGLFDRRALAAAERRSEVDADQAALHAERIAGLERSRTLRLVSSPLAVLIAWR